MPKMPCCGVTTKSTFAPKVCPQCGTNQREFKEQEKEARKLAQKRNEELADKYKWISWPMAIITCLAGVAFGFSMGGWILGIILGFIGLALGYTYGVKILGLVVVGGFLLLLLYGL